MTILEHNLENVFSQAQVSMGDLGERILKAKEGVDGVLEKMREQGMMLIEEKRKIEEIALMCEKTRYSDIVSYAKVLRETRDVNTKNKQGKTVLVGATGANLEEIVKTIIAHPSTEVNEPDNNGFTALMWAALLGDVAITKTLLEDPRIMIHECGQLLESYKLTKNEEIMLLLKEKLDFHHIYLLP